VSGEPIDPGVIELAGRVFDLARGGCTEELVAYVDAGVPVNLTADHSRVNDRGQTALAAAVFRQSTEAVERLLAAGADPGAGEPSARATAAFFDLPAMTELLAGHP
jgi:hypothetical protein